MIIDDDKEWARYYESLLGEFELESYRDCVAAVDRMAEKTPDLVLLDILLVGPTGFSILNEMQSYPDLSKVPVFVISSVDLDEAALRKYGVAKVFNKGAMLPSDILSSVKEYIHA
ncbi:MAG: response regulator [Candidatus Saccharimonadales bacterium]